MHQTISLLAAAIVALLLGAPRARAADDAMMCGPNSAYLLLRLCGVAVNSRTPALLAAAAPGGLSLVQLRTACANYGLETAVRKCSIEELRGDFSGPVIAWTRDMAGDLQTRHYVVVTKVSGQWIYLMDGTTGRISRTTIQKLSPFWLGFILAPRAQRPPFWPAALAWCAAAIAAASLWRLRKLAAGAVLIALISAHSAAAATLPWRTAEHDGINCLYVQLRLLGYTGRYDQFTAAAQSPAAPDSLQGLSQLARSLSFNLAPVRLTAAQLWSLNSPCIVYMEPAGIGRGTFSLFLGPGEKTVALIDGAAMTITEADASAFRRNWTGYALVAAPSPPRWRTIARIASVAAVFAAALLWLAIPTRKTLHA